MHMQASNESTRPNKSNLRWLVITAVELDLTLLLQTTADRAEGVRAFAAKRPPDFIGR